MWTPAVQLAGYLLATAGFVWLFGPWALVGAGVVLLIVPEIVNLSRREAPRDAALRSVRSPRDPVKR